MSEQGTDVLIIDDEQAYRDSIGATLRGQGLEVQLADSMEQAREQARVSSPSLVLLDLRLPGSDGLANLEEWLGLAVPARVIVLSDATAQEQVLEALRRGAADYLAKPVHEEELRLAVRRGLEGWALARDLQRWEARLDELAARTEALCDEIESSTVGEAVDGLIRQGVVDIACDTLHARRASLLLLDTVGDHLVLVASSGEWSVRDEVEPIRCDQGVSGLVFDRAEPTRVTDMAADPAWAALRRTDRYVSPSFVAVPITKAEAVVGLLFVTEPMGRAAFQTGDLSLLRLAVQPLVERLRGPQPGQFGAEPPPVSDLRGGTDPLSSQATSSLTADVLPKSEWQDELDRDAEIAREICQSVADEVDPSRVLAVALGRVAALLPAAPVSLYLTDTTTGQLRCEASLDGGVGEDRPDLLAQRGLTGVAVQTGQLVASADPSSDPRFDPEVDTPLSGAVKPLLCLPLRLRGKSVGLFRAFLPEGAWVSSRTAEVMAAALSAALRSVLLYRSLVESIEEVAEARRQTRG